MEASRALAIVNPRKTEAEAYLGRLSSSCAARGIHLEVHREDGPFPCPEPGFYSLCFTLGGDGTVLYAARSLAASGVPLFPINLGTLGFIAEMPREDWESYLDRYLSGQLPLSRRIMGRARVERGGRTVWESVFLNDAVMAATGIAKVVSLRALVDGAPLGTYRADGMIVATPTGSTAYSLSAGGPILMPEMEAFIVNPICPFTLALRAVVIPSSQEVAVEVAEKQRSDLILTIDGQTVIPLLPGDRVRVTEAEHPVRVVAADSRSFCSVLRSKLNWSGGCDA
jgi:NAD+ kinase